MSRERPHLARAERHGPGRVLRTALSTTLAGAALLGLPAAASSDGLDAVEDLEETADVVERELP